ncbi:hypothetical protein FQR65_LT10381 [Abscondita terminalis]|nr:hypothetical protein FQR65_LT10381 [Abscondita terminalis]
MVDYKIVDNVIYTSDIDINPDPKGIGHFYYSHMIKNKDKIAQVDGYTKEEDSFGSLLQRSVRTALAMIDIGIKPGDHISLCTNNHLNSIVPFIASYFTGSIMGAIEPTMSAKDASFLAVPLVEKVIESIGTETIIVVFGETSQHTPFSKFILPHKNEHDFKPYEPENLRTLSLIVFSSGTSGMPKGICFDHFSMLSLNNSWTVHPEFTIYTIANPYWSVFPIFFHASVEIGSKRIVYPFFNTDDPWTLYYQPVDVAFLNPLQALHLVRTKITDKVNLKNVKVLVISGNPITLKQVIEIQSVLSHTLVTYSYSQSELFKNCFESIHYESELWKNNKHSVGTIKKGFFYKIVDIDTEEVLGPNQVGELRIKSPSQFVGYYNKDSSERFDADGWLKTGDFLYYNEDLCFYFVERIGESFKYLNIHISPVEIEKIILDLEPIETAVVIGLPHETEYNHPMAVIKLKPNARKITAEEIIKHVENNLENSKWLRGGVKFVETIPLTVTGKVDGYTKEEDTFGSLLQRSVRTALAMIDIGIKPGDHISLCTYNHLNSIVPFVASYLTGSIMGAIEPSMSVKDATYLLRQTLPKLIFATSSAVPLVEKVVESIGTETIIIVFGETPQHIPFSKFILPHKNEHDFKPYEPENLNKLAIIVFSSGTSGMPKGICFDHASMISINKSFIIPSECTFFTISNPYWSVYSIFLHISIESCGRRIVYPSFSTDDPWALFYQHVDMAFLNIPQVLHLIRTKMPDKVNLKNVKLLTVGGNPLTLKQMKEIQSVLPHTIIAYNYGQTELFKGSFELIRYGTELWNNNQLSVGTLKKGNCYKVVDVDTEEVLGPNQVGELRIKSPSQFIGYFNKDSSDRFDSDGWLKTGDSVYYNEDLCFYFVDRIGESFKYFHYHISPTEIENVILDLESIETAVVMGLPHESECNHTMAVVKLKPNAKKISAEEIIKHVEENLENRKWLRGGVKFMDTLPMTVTGKVNRAMLKKLVLESEQNKKVN